MFTFLASIMGFITAGFPQALKLWQTKLDYAHETEMFQLQIEANRVLGDQRVDEAVVGSDTAQMDHIYTQQVIGIGWVDSINALIRPFLTLCFFFLYCYVKYLLFISVGAADLGTIATVLWGVADMDIFASIIGYWFGQRAWAKVFDARFQQRQIQNLNN